MPYGNKMIEINLIPEDLITKPKGKKIGLGGLGIEPKHAIYLVPLVLGFVLLIHVYLAGLMILKNHQFAALTKKWQNLAPQRKVLEEFNKEYSIFSSEAQSVKQLIQRRLNWAEKLNKLSSLLPSGIWFTEVSASPKDFTLRGSAVSLQKDEMSLIKQFMDNLKQDSAFFKDFNNLELGSVQKKTIGGYDIAEFILTGTLKSK